MTDGVLFVHAFPLDATMWQEQLRAIGERVPSTAVNLPGFGGTSSAGLVMTMAAAAERCEEELHRLQLDRAVVCGLSMGGYVALELWRRSPDRIAGLVLANTRAEPDTEEGKERRHEVAERVLAEGVPSILDTMRTLVSLEASEDLWSSVAEMVKAQPASSVAAASLGMAERPDSRPDLPGISVPTLVITSSGDQLITPDISSAMADAIPDAELAVIDRAGHLSNLEQPNAFNRLLEKHLQRVGLL